MPFIDIHLFHHKGERTGTKYRFSSIDLDKPNIKHPFLDKFYEMIGEEITILQDQNTTLLLKIEDLKRIESNITRVPAWIRKICGVK